MDSPLEIPTEPSRKRKREQLDENDNPVTPSSSNPPAESLAGSPQKGLHESVPHSAVEALETTTDTLNPEPQLHGRPKPHFRAVGQAFVDVAQMVARQAVSEFLPSNSAIFDGVDPVAESIPDRSLLNTMIQFLSTFFPTNKHCSLKDFVSLGEKMPATVSREQATMSQRGLKPPHMAGGLTATVRSIFKLDSPYTRVQRNGASTEISASALSFWEELSLGPSHETKDIDVFCVCPKNRYIEEGVMAFLNMVKGAYQSCKLGSHDFGASPADHSQRIVTVVMNTVTPDDLLQSVASACEGLGSKLPEFGLQSGTTVVYVINPFNDQQYLPGLWDALSRLPNSYRKRRLQRQNDLVMRIVPLELVWSPERIVVPSPADYRRLAFEVYNNCGRESDFVGTPAIRLAKAVPKTIDFKLVSEGAAPLTQSDNCVHVSYTWDPNNEWLAASWTDNFGVLSWVACYCLGKDEEAPWKPFSKASREILETSFDMLRPPNVPWRLVICKDSPLPKMEVDGKYSGFVIQFCIPILT